MNEVVVGFVPSCVHGWPFIETPATISLGQEERRWLLVTSTWVLTYHAYARGKARRASDRRRLGAGLDEKEGGTFSASAFACSLGCLESEVSRAFFLLQDFYFENITAVLEFVLALSADAFPREEDKLFCFSFTPFTRHSTMEVFRPTKYISSAYHYNKIKLNQQCIS